MHVFSFYSLEDRMPDTAELPWGDTALVNRFAAARDLFNQALPRFKHALQFYQLDGWVTEHVNIVMEISNLYRWGANKLLWW